MATGNKLPESCCTRNILSLNGTITNRENCVRATSDFYKEGCESKLKAAYWVVGGVCLAILAIEVSLY